MTMSMWEILFLGGGTIGYVLWALSVVTVAIIVRYVWSIRRANVIPENFRARVKEMFAARQYREAIELTDADPSFLSYTLHAALSEAPHGHSSMARAMADAVEERTAKLLRQVEWLNLIGNVSPMLGLLGTVWGMINAFFKIVQKGGTPDPAHLAESIGVALVTTLLGLGVAIPALSVYGLMRNRVDALSSEAMVTAEELISSFRDGQAETSAASPQQQP